MPAAGVGLIALGAWLSTGHARLTVLNDALRFDYPFARSGGAATAALGLLLIAFWARSWRRLVPAFIAILCAGVSVHLLVYRLEASRQALEQREALGTTRLTWAEVRNVESDGTLIVVSGLESTVSIDTTDFTPDQRSVLNRSLARHVREAGERSRRVDGASKDRAVARR